MGFLAFAFPDIADRLLRYANTHSYEPRKPFPLPVWPAGLDCRLALLPAVDPFGPLHQARDPNQDHNSQPEVESMPKPVSPIPPAIPVSPLSSREALADTAFPSTVRLAHNISFRLTVVAEAVQRPIPLFDEINDELRTVLSDLNILRDRLHARQAPADTRDLHDSMVGCPENPAA